MLTVRLTRIFTDCSRTSGLKSSLKQVHLKIHHALKETSYLTDSRILTGSGPIATTIAIYLSTDRCWRGPLLLAKLLWLQPSEPDHYATLGLDRDCTETHIRSAYRLLAKQYHPDVNHGSSAAQAQTQALNAAYEILSDPERRTRSTTGISTPLARRP